MTNTPERIISRLVVHLAARPGVRGVALVGSRGSGDPRRIDEHSDADFLVCCADGELAALLNGDWIAAAEPPLQLFPPLMKDEIRVLFDGLFACDVHLLTVSQAEALAGPCALGSHFTCGLSILHDPDGVLARLAERVRREPPEPRDPETTSAVFWHDLAYCAHLVLRGDLLRAAHFSNWYLQILLLDLVHPTDEPDALKYVERKIRPEQYRALAATVAPLVRTEMAAALRRCMRCYWRLQRDAAPGLDPAKLATYRRIEEQVEGLLATEFGPERVAAGD